MVVQEALLDMDLACGHLHRLTTHLMENLTIEEGKRLRVNVKHLHRVVRKELKQVRMPSIARPSQVEMSEESINQVPNMSVEAGQGREKVGPSGY